MTSRGLWKFQYRFAPYLFVAPFVALFCVFMLYPLGRSIQLSLYKTAGPHSRQFVGLGNYAFFLNDIMFWVAVANTTAFTIAFLCLQIPASLGLALLLNSRMVRFRNFFRFAFFSSHLVGNVFVAVIFLLLLAPRHGLIARLLGAFYQPWSEIDFLGHPVYARIAVVIASLWLSVGWGMIFFLAALQSVDRELYEAANVDGAGGWARFWHVTMPGIRPVLIFLVLAGMIGAYQLFELPYVLFQGSGPAWAGLTVVMYLFQNGFEMGDIGAASAIGWMLVVLILIISLTQLKLTKVYKEDAR